MSPSLSRRCLVAAATVALALALPGPAVAAEPIKVGAVLSVTGPAAFLGDPEQKTLELYVKRINEEGGVLGRPLELVVYDDGGDASKARTFAQRLVEEDEVVAMVGGTSTGTTMAMAPVFEDAEVPFISLAGGIEIVEPVNPWVFKMPHTDRMACQKIFEDMKAKRLSRLGLISGTGGFGASMRKQCTAVAPDYGVTIVADETYGPKDTDVTPQLTKIRGSDAQAVLNADFGQGPAVVTRNYRQLGIDLPLYQSHGVASKQFIQLAGDAANGVRLPAAALLVAGKLPDSDPQKQVLVGYQQAFESAFNQPVSTFGGHAYDGLMILADSIKRANSAEPAAIRDAIEATKGFVGTAGMFNMTPEDHMGLDLSAFRMLEIEGGDWTVAD
jgi:branched-chain amino acid transport system substrate-binding protein